MNDHVICLQHRRGHASGLWFSVFVNVGTGEKRLVGLPIEPKSTPDGRHIVFVHRGVLYIDFRPVYPMPDEVLPDFGSQEGWNAYKERYYVRKEKRPYERVEEFPFHFVSECTFTSSGKVLLIDDRPRGNERLQGLGRELPPVPSDAPPPVLLAIDPNRIEKAKTVEDYTTLLATLPKDAGLRFQRTPDGELRVVGDQAKISWNKSAAEIP